MADSQAGALLADLRRASEHLKRRRRADALEIYRRVCDRADGLAQVQFELGNLCREIGDIRRAIPHYELARDGAPDHIGYVSTLGIAYLNAGEPERAREVLERALSLNPDNATSQHGMGAYYMQRGDYEAAIAHLERACELKPSDASIRENLVVTLNRLNRHDAALVHGRKGIALNDASPGAHFVLAETLAETGDIDAAVRQLEKIIRRHKTFGLAYELLARLRKFSASDEALISKTEKVLEQGMPAADRAALHFALAKMHDDCGHYEEAFAHYEQGNLLQKRDYDLGLDKQLLEDAKKLFTAKWHRECGALGRPSSTPVFIVGMPRSGTTLMERIIASHPEAAGAGELAEITRLASLLYSRNDGKKSIRDAKAALTPENIGEWAEGYLDILRQGRREASRIVDKMPGNFFFLGLIKTLFPNATIIHAVRHPLGSCLSCYFQSFTRLAWTNDLATIGKIYALYRKTMLYWQDVLPPGSIVDVHYEQLVEDPETQARLMLEACGLDWEPSVLEFFRQQSVVKTASIAQARQPIYASSKMRWVNYASHLEPLTAELGPLLEHDREALLAHGVELPTAFSRLKRWLN